MRIDFIVFLPEILVRFRDAEAPARHLGRDAGECQRLFEARPW